MKPKSSILSSFEVFPLGVNLGVHICHACSKKRSPLSERGPEEARAKGGSPEQCKCFRPQVSEAGSRQKAHQIKINSLMPTLNSPDLTSMVSLPKLVLPKDSTRLEEFDAAF